jgi:hypothetical protein
VSDKTNRDVNMQKLQAHVFDLEQYQYDDKEIFELAQSHI